MIEKTIHYVSNNDGWELALRRRVDPGKFKRDRRPVAIVPGYGMNSFIFSYHPKGLALEEYIASRGFEVWSMDLRRQGESRRTAAGKPLKDKPYGLRELSTVDIPAAMDYIAAHTESTDGTGLVDCVGCSLAGSLLCIYIVMGKNQRVGSFVALGAPVRWVEVPAFVKIAFASPRIIGNIPFRKSRAIAGFLLPKVIKIPHLLDLYIHGSHADMTHVEKLVQTVEDPIRQVNREIAVWAKKRDLIIDGTNISLGMKKFKNPVLCVVANADGIVPPKTALSLLDLVSSDVRDSFTVGTKQIPFAHADLYLSNHAEEMHFKPVAEWLENRYKNV
jgi:pimeloyl-ACP methyl ester carboxylesterase